MKANANYSLLYDYIHKKLVDDIYFFSFEAENSQNEFFGELRKFTKTI